MSGEVIKEFLVGLGFDIDEEGLNKFASGVFAASTKVMALGAATVAAASAVFAGVKSIAGEYDELDKLATRFRTTAEAVDDFADMAQVLGLSKEQSIGSLKSLDQAIADTAMGMGRAKLVFEELGIQVTDATGKMKPTTEVMDELAVKMQGMERGRAIRVMERLGLDPALMKLFNADLVQLRQELDEIDKAAGFDLGDAVAESKAFMSAWKAVTIELNKVKMVFEKLYESVGVKLMPKFREGLDRFRIMIEQFRHKLMDNLNAIREAVLNVINVITRGAEFFMLLFMRVFTVVSDVVSGIISWFSKLDSTTQMVILGILGIAAAWKFLNLGFLATPIGMVVALGAAILALYDDFMTWKEGGDSLIDWEAWEPGITSAMDAVAALRDMVASAFNAIYAAVDLVASLLTGDFSRAWFAVGELVGSVVDIFKSAWGVISNIGGALGNFAGAALTPSPQSAAAGGQQSVSQKTDIIIQGGSDPASTARAVANEQGRVNADMARNLKGVAR